MTQTSVPKLVEMVPPDDMALIASLAVRRTYGDGELIYERGDEPREVGIVRLGRVKLTYPRSDGTEVFSGLIHTGQNFGDAEMLHGLFRNYRATAIGETTVDHLRGGGLEEAMRRPAIMAALYRVATFRLNIVLGALDDMRVLSPDRRLAKLLLRMHAASGGMDEVPFLQEDLAGMLGISTVTLAKSLGRLKQNGFLDTGYRHIVLRDPQRLAEWLRSQGVD